MSDSGIERPKTECRSAAIGTDRVNLLHLPPFWCDYFPSVSQRLHRLTNRPSELRSFNRLL